jgi:hypothetical protein
MEDCSVKLSKEQAEMLLPLIPALQKSTSAIEDGSGCRFTIDEMFAKERPRGRSTPAQNYLLVSFLGALANCLLSC